MWEGEPHWRWWQRCVTMGHLIENNLPHSSYVFYNITDTKAWGTDPELTICLAPEHVSQMQFSRVPRGLNQVGEGTRFLEGVLDLHHLLACDQRVSAKIYCGKTERVKTSLVTADAHQIAHAILELLECCNSEKRSEGRLKKEVHSMCLVLRKFDKWVNDIMTDEADLVWWIPLIRIKGMEKCSLSLAGWLNGHVNSIQIT